MDRKSDRQADRGMGRISHNGALCISNLNRMGRVDRVKWVGLHCYHQDILSLYNTTFQPVRSAFRGRPNHGRACVRMLKGKLEKIIKSNTNTAWLANKLLRPKRCVIQSNNILVIAMQSDTLHSDKQTHRQCTDTDTPKSVP